MTKAVNTPSTRSEPVDPTPVTTTAPPAPAAPADQHAGRGGLYELVDGERVLVARTGTDKPAQ